MQNDKHDVEAPNLSEDELYFRSKILRELEKARTQRENSHAEFDDQTFSEYWESNAKAANSYIPPKINEFDVRTTTGTTKENLLLPRSEEHTFPD